MTTTAHIDEISSFPPSNTSEDWDSAPHATDPALNPESPCPDPVDVPLPLVPGDSHWGIDTVHISYEILLDQCELALPHEIWRRSSIRMEHGIVGERWSGSKACDPGHLDIDLHTTRSTCYVKFNAARFISEDPLYLLPPDALLSLVEGIIGQLSRTVWPAFMVVTEHGEIVLAPDWAEQVRITRLDVARNLTVPREGAMRRALEAVQSRYGRSKRLLTSSGGGWSVYNSSATCGQDLLYDKRAEAMKKDKSLGSTVPEGTYRFEAQMRGDRLKRLGLDRLQRVNKQRAWEALAHRWEQTRWGSPISSGGDLSEALDGLTPDMALRILGFLCSEATGGVVKLDVRKSRDLARMCRDLGLTPGLPIEELGGGARRIDLFAGGLFEA